METSTPTPKPKFSPRPVDKRPSTPVRNPAFREHEGLRALQKQLNSRPYGVTAPSKSK